VFGTQVRLFLNDTQEFIAPTETGYADLSANATDALSIRLNAKNYLVLADANGYTYFDGTTWAHTAGNGTTIPKTQWLEEFDNRLYTLDVENRLWSSLDLVTWVEHEPLPVPTDEVRGLDVFFDPGEKPQLHVPTVTGLYLYDIDGDVWQRTRLRFPRHQDGGRGHVQWRDEYYESAGLTVYHYQGSVVSPSGLDRDDSLPRELLGSIVAMEAMPSFLAAAVSGNQTASGAIHFRGDAMGLDASRATDTTGQSAIYIWGGSAWQPLWVASQAGTVMHFLHYSDADDTYRLWWGTNERVYYLEFAGAVFQPRLAPTWPFAQTSYIETGRFDADWPEQRKLAVRTKVRLKNASATERVLVYYRIDQSDSWIFLATVDTNGITTIPMEDTVGAGDGLLWDDFEYRVVLERDPADSSLSPTLIYVKLEYARRPDARFGYRFQVVLDEDSPDGHTPAEQFAYLQALATEKHLVPFEYRPDDRSPVTGTVMISQITAITMPGLETSGRWMISVLQPS
jgi:hypothetical protein